jgi:CHAT domain-containing protein
MRGDATRLDPELLAAVGAVLREARTNPSTPARHGAAVASLLAQRTRTALEELKRLAEKERDPAIWNDLAAAYYVDAATSRRPAELADALVAVDTALRWRPDFAEARFNRALIVERLGIRDPAVAAWKRFLELDGSSAWALEARRHLQALSNVEPPFREVFRRDYDRLAASPELARQLARRYPQEARTWGETEILARWADSHLRGDLAAEVRHRGLARVIGDEIARRGDRMLQRAVEAIDHADGERRRALADGHLDFKAGQRAFMDGRPGDAEPILRRAGAALAAGGSPVALLARFFAAYMAYEQGRVAAGARELEGLLATVPDDLPTCRAKIQWQLAICRGAENRLGEDIEFAKASLANFERVGEPENAAMMREHLAQAHELIGDWDEAWVYRSSALPEIGRASTTFLQAGVLGFLSQEAVFRRDWPAAASWTELEIEVAKMARYGPDLADAHLRRALIRGHLGFGDPSGDLRAAREMIAAIPDAGMRTRLEARRVAAEALVASTPEAAVPLLTTAIRFHEGSGGQRMFLPTLFVNRARAHRALHDSASARKDLDAAIAELDSGRGSLPAAEQRIGMFESADAIFDEAIDLAIADNDAIAAFHYAEHARARTLLETMRSAGSMRAAETVPADSAIVEYAVLPSSVIVFVVDARGIRAIRHAVRREDLRARVAELTEALSSDAPHPRALARSLYADLLGPVEEWIRAKTTLIVVPDATLSAVPFAALVTRDDRFLIENHAIVSAPSAAVYAHFSAGQTKAPAGPRVLVVANPANDANDLSVLAAVERESRSIAALYADAITLSGAEATPRAFAREVTQANVIHFAGHALSSEYRSDDAALVLAGTAGRLGIAEIGKLRLGGCSTVVLAACSTARGKVQRYEGTISVARAFLSTGVPSVVASLWPIDDEEAARFFPRFHEHLASGVSAAEALRAAQLEWIRKSGSPSLWAAVQVIGS